MNAFSFDEDPGIDGPDYVALVIEWEDEDEVTAVINTMPSPIAASARMLAAAVGALVALAFATWGIHRLRAA
jgi:hypothetical protein